MESIRIDKWLWATRLFKTRSRATEACRKGQIRIENTQAKASRDIKVGDIISIHQHGIIKTVKVLQILKNRVGAKLVPEYLRDLTPEEEYEKLYLTKSRGFEYRDRGAGRPTKRERRDLDKLKKKLD